MKSLSESDLKLAEEHGISREEALNQQQTAAKGVPGPKVLRTASIDDGILLFTPQQVKDYAAAWDAYLEKGNIVSHFIPASGKAGRFFRDLYAFLNSDDPKPRTNFEKNFFRHLESFAFFEELDAFCIEHTGENVHSLILQCRFKEIVEYLLTEKGLNYGALPSALFKFHVDNGSGIFSLKKYLPKKIVNYYSTFDSARTPIQECMIESAMVSGVKNGTVKMHFTVTEDSKRIINDYIHDFRFPVEKKFNISMPVSLPCQEPSTDALVFNADGSLHKDAEGRASFVPGGHGTLLPEFGTVATDVVFIKNIDNVELDNIKKMCALYKKMLGGYLITIQKQVAKYYKLLEKGEVANDKLIEVINYVENTLNIKNEAVLSLSKDKMIEYLKDKLNRPIRVCGMVKNEYEQGGMPCWVSNPDGTASLQIVEFYQINDNPEVVKMFKMSTHFNPVDLVCYISDSKGKPFDLNAYADHEAYIVYTKTIGDEEVKYVEKPGLWNGCMADWITLFVEVPIKTFNPVKNINDLLRYEHQNS